MARKQTQEQYQEKIEKTKTKIAELEEQIKGLKAELTELELAKMTQYLKDTEGEGGKSLYDIYTNAESK